MRRVILFSLIFFMPFVGCASATDYYVSTAGNNTNPGTQENPFLTISYAMSIASEGDYIYISPGTYPERLQFNNTVETHLTLVGIGESKPIITNSIGKATIEIGKNDFPTVNAHGHTFRNLEIINTDSESASDGKGICCMYRANASDILVDNCTIRSYYNAFDVSNGQHTNITIQNSDLHTMSGAGVYCGPTYPSTLNIINNDIYAAETYITSSGASGISLNSLMTVNCSDNRIHTATYTGIKPNAASGIFHNNTIMKDGYGHNAYENKFRNAIISYEKILGHNVSIILAGGASNPFYNSGTTEEYNVTVTNFYTNDTTGTLCAVGGHQHDYYIENFTADNHNGNPGFRVFGFTGTIPVQKYSSNNIVFKNCTMNTTYTASGYSPVQVYSIGTNVSSNPSPYIDQSPSAYTPDNVTFINTKFGGNYLLSSHVWTVTDKGASAYCKHCYGTVRIINSMDSDDILMDVGYPNNFTATAESMYYADIILQYANGTKIAAAPVTFTTTTANPETGELISPVNINASSGQKSYIDLVSGTFTDANGRTPLPSNIAETVAITDFIKSKNSTTELTWTIDAGGVVLDDINPDTSWYRDNQDQTKYPITAIINDSSDTHFTGFSPDMNYTSYDAGDSVKFQIWTNEPLTSVSWKKDGVETAIDVMAYTTTISDAPITVEITGESINGTVSKTWVVDPDQTIIIPEDPESPGIIPESVNFTATPTSGIVRLSVQFNDTSINATNWYWDFDNDGITDSTIQNPICKYKTPGEYTVKLTVSNTGGMDTETKTDYITATKQNYLVYIWNWFSNIFLTGGVMCG